MKTENDELMFTQVARRYINKRSKVEEGNHSAIWDQFPDSLTHNLSDLLPTSPYLPPPTGPGGQCVMNMVMVPYMKPR